MGGQVVGGTAVQPPGTQGGRAHKHGAGLLHKWTHATGAPSHGGRGQGASKGSGEERKAEQRVVAPHASAREKQRQVVGDTNPA